MLLHMDGFDHYTTAADTASNVAVYLQAAGYSILNANAGTFGLAQGQDLNSLGVKLSIAAGSNTPPSFSKSFNTAAGVVVFGFSFRGVTNRFRLARINGQVDIDWDVATGKLKYGSNLGVDVIILNAFYSMEIEIDKTNMEVRVWANDALQLTFPLPAGAIGPVHSIQWGPTTAQASAGTIEIDDFYALDNSGGINVARLGPTQVLSRAPTADVTTEWTPVGSTGTHASIAAQLSPNGPSAPYLQANIEGKVDRFTSNNVMPNDNQVFAVSLVAYSRKGDLDDRHLGLIVGTAGGETEVSVPLTTSYGYKTAMFERAPGDADWNQSRVESATFGIIAR